MHRITHCSKYVEFTDKLCGALYSASLVNPCDSEEYDPLHEYHPAFADGSDDPRDEDKIWAVLVAIAEDYGEGVKTEQMTDEGE